MGRIRLALNIPQITNVNHRQRLLHIESHSHPSSPLQLLQLLELQDNVLTTDSYVHICLHLISFDMSQTDKEVIKHNC